MNLHRGYKFSDLGFFYTITIIPNDVVIYFLRVLLLG